MLRSKRCPKCKRMVVSDQYEWHLEHGHDIGGALDATVDDEDYPDDGFNTADFRQKNLDASKNVGYPCREQGAYGSYPSYDGFDDESES